MNSKIIRLTTGALASSIMLQSCDGYVYSLPADELNQQISDQGLEGTSIAVPVNLDEESVQQLVLIEQLTTDIIENPDIAAEFSKSPTEYCQKKGLGAMHINANDPILKLCTALSDKDVAMAAKNGDVNRYICLCKQKGLLKLDELNQSKFLKELSSQLKQKRGMTRAGLEQNIQSTGDTPIASVVYGFLAVVIAAVAVEAVIVIGTVTWVTHVHQSKAIKDKSRFTQIINEDSTAIGDRSKFATIDEDSTVIKLFTLKNGDVSKTYQVATAEEEEVLEIANNTISTQYPELKKDIDEQTLRNLILINMRNNQ